MATPINWLSEAATSKKSAGSVARRLWNLRRRRPRINGRGITGRQRPPMMINHNAGAPASDDDATAACFKFFLTDQLNMKKTTLIKKLAHD